MNSIKVKRYHVELIISALFISAGVLGLARAILFQDIVWVSNGLGWDGGHYDRLLKHFTSNGSLNEVAAFPFCGRIGTAWILANVFDGQIGFYEFNIVVSAAFSIVLVFVTAPLWKGNIKAFTAALAIPNFLFFAPLKLTNFNPTYMDPPFMLLLAFALYFAIKQRYNLAGILCMLAVPFREAAFYIIPIFVVFAITFSDRRVQSLVIGFISIIVGFAIKVYVLHIADCESQSQTTTAFWWLYRLLTDPTRTLSVVAAFSLTLGPLVLLSRQGVSKQNFLENRVLLFSIFATIYVGSLSAIGGSDVTRIFYSFIPLYAPVLIIGFAKLDLSGFALACFGWLLTNQVLHKYEQPIAESPNNDLTGFFAQFPDHAHPVVAVVILMVWLILQSSHGYLLRIENFVFDRPLNL